MFTTNEVLGNITKQYEAATVTYSTIISDGYGACLIDVMRGLRWLKPMVELNVKEMLPPRMDDSGRTKYPVLFRVCVQFGFSLGGSTDPID